MIDWSIEGIEFVTCNCVAVCPCQLDGEPTTGHCRGFEVVRIDRGHFGATRLDGLLVAMTYAWPGPIYKGNGELQAIVDERADAAQRPALETVLHGGETDDAATHWWVYNAMSSIVHPTLFRPIELACDVAARRATVRIAGVLEAIGRPIISPATGQPRRPRLDIPSGIELELAEIGSAAAKAEGAIPLDLTGTYAQFNALRHSGAGVVR